MGLLIPSRTHGRREAVFPDWAREGALAPDTRRDTASAARPMLNRAANARPIRCVGFEGSAPAAGRIGAAMPFKQTPFLK